MKYTLTLCLVGGELRTIDYPTREEAEEWMEYFEENLEDFPRLAWCAIAPTKV